MVNDGNGLAEALLGLPGFRVLPSRVRPLEASVPIETTSGTSSSPHRAMALLNIVVASAGFSARYTS